MDKNQVIEKIKQRAQLSIQKLELEAQYNKWFTEALPEEVQDELKKLEQRKNQLMDQVATITADLEVEKQTALNNANAVISKLEDEIIAAVIELKGTVKVEGIASCIYNGGKVTWNTEALEGLMEQEGKEFLKALRKEGKPYAYFK